MVMTKSPNKVSLFDRLQARSNKSRGWTTQDIADLYRIGDQLTQFGFPVVVHTGQSDEGDPWAIFERDSTDEVVVHVARIDGELVIVDVVRDRTHRGKDFRSLANKLLDEAPLTLPRVEDRGNVVLHPRMVMTAFVAAAFVLAEFANPTEAEAASLESSADNVLQDKPLEGQGHTVAPSAPRDHDLAEKLAGRDGVGGVYSAQAIGMTGLAAGLVALSTHLVLNGAKDPEAGTAGSESDAARLFDGAVQAQAAMILAHDALLFDDRGFAPGYSPQTPEEQAAVGAKLGARQHIEIEIEDLNILSAALTSPVAVPPPPAEEGAPVALERLSVQQDYRAIIELKQPGTLAAPTFDKPVLDVSEAFARVVGSVTLLDQSQLSALRFEGDAEGAIVVMMSDLTDNLDNIDELIGSFSASSPQGGTELDISHAVSERYQLLSELSQHVHLTPGVANILVYAGGDVEVSGFAFGRDSIAFIDSLTPLEWLESVDIVGSDVVLVGYGGSVTLYDAVATFV